MTYQDKLRDPRWQKLRLEILTRDGWTCQLCGDTQTELQVHHLVYNISRDPWDVSPDDLTTYCKHCHLLIEYLKGKGKDVIPSKVIKKTIEDVAGNSMNRIGLLLIHLIGEASYLNVFWYTDCVIHESDFRFKSDTLLEVIRCMYPNDEIQIKKLNH